MPHVVERESLVGAPIEQVWAQVTDPEGILLELRPWLTMTMPPGAENVSIATLRLGEPIGRAWIKLFGLVPIDYDDLCIIGLEPGRSFHEKSTMMSASEWQHERTLTPLDEGSTRVHDRLTFTLRLPLRPIGRIYAWVIGALFSHRHRRLTASFSSRRPRRGSRRASAPWRAPRREGRAEPRATRGVP